MWSKILMIILVIAILLCVYCYPDSPSVTFGKLLNKIRDYPRPPSLLGDHTYSDGFWEGVKATTNIITYIPRMLVYSVKAIGYTFETLVGTHNTIASDHGGSTGHRGGR